MQLTGSSIKISIVLPSYNTCKHISKAIDSFLQQDYANKELIIVDGKSTDSSHEIIQNYVTSNDNIIWIKDKDINVTDAINIGISYSTGDFCAFLAADVFYYSNDIFSTIANNYAMLPFDVIYFDYYCYFPELRKILHQKCPNLEFTKNNLLLYGTIAGFDNVFISKEVYKTHKYNPQYNLVSDWEFFLRISQEKLAFLYVEKICTVNVQDGDNLSLKFLNEQKRQSREVANLYNSDGVIPHFINLNNQPFFNRFFIRLKRKSQQYLGRGYKV